MGSIDGKTQGHYVARALVQGIGDEFMMLNEIAATVTAMEYAQGNYITMTEVQVKRASGYATQILETQSKNELTVEPLIVEMIDTGRVHRSGRKAGTPILKKNFKGRVDTHVGYRIVRYNNSSRLFDMLAKKKKQADGITRNIEQTVRVALQQENEMSGQPQLDFMSLLDLPKQLPQ